MFYAPLVAALMCNPLVGLGGWLIAAFATYLVTDAPPLAVAADLAVKLVLFILLTQSLHRKWPSFWGAEPLAYVATGLTTHLLLALLPRASLVAMLLVARPGLMVLAALTGVIFKRFDDER